MEMKTMFCIFVVLALSRSVVYSETGVGQVLKSETSCGPMLESILRLERAVTNMSWELKLTKATSESTVTSLKATDQKLDSAMSRISNLTEQIDKDKGIVFQVRLSTTGSYCVGNSESLKFDDVMLNKGDGYNPTSGIFTVPKTGIYHCWANVLPSYKKAFNVKLLKEGETLVESYTGSLTNPGNNVLSSLSACRKGDHIWFAIKGVSACVNGGFLSSYGCYLMNL